MTQVDLAALEQLAAQATPGPWRACYWPLPEPTHHVMQEDPSPWSSRSGPPVTGPCASEDNARFIAACSPDVVTALVRAVQAALDVRNGFPFLNGEPGVDYDGEWREFVATLAPFQEQP